MSQDPSGSARSVRETSSGRSLAGCLVGGLLVLAAIAAVVVFLVRRSDQQEARIEREFLQPWREAVRGGTLTESWPRLTAPGYRGGQPEAAVARTWQQVVERWGAPRSAGIVTVNGVKEPGRAGFERVVTRWKFEGGQELHLTFELIDVPGSGFRAQATRLSSKGHIRPQGTPDGPW